VAVGDVNRDGLPDLVVANSVSDTVSVLLNTTAPGAASPSFSAQQTFATGGSPIFVAVRDLNGDGLPDLAVANYLSATVSVLLNTTAPGAASASFSAQQTFATGNNPDSLATGDVNGDGLPDLVVTNETDNTVSVLLNTTAPGAATPSFSAQQAFATGNGPRSVAAGDVNGDGLPDLTVANVLSSTVSVLLNTTAAGAATASFSAQLTFATGDAPGSVSVGDVNGDGRRDLAVANLSSNNVSVLLNAPVTIADDTGVGTILDDDAPPVVGFTAATQSVSEAVGSVTVTAQLSALSGLDVTVPFMVSGTATGGGTDHNLANGTITVLAGSAAGSVTFNLTQDSLDELDETVVVTLGGPTNATLGGTTVQTVTILDDDAAPVAGFTAAAQSVSEGAGTATVTVQLSAVSGLDVTVPFTVSGTAIGGGTDHNLANGTIAVIAGNTAGSVTFNVTQDLLDEPDETVVVTLGTPANATLGGTTVQTVTILDDDAAPTVGLTTAAQSVSEAVGTVTVTAQLSAVSSFVVTVPFAVSGTATGGGTDHNLANGAIMVLAGSAAGSVTFNVTQDSLDEANETVVITVGTPTNATLAGTTVETITIADDDPAPTVAFAAAAQSVSEGAGTATVMVQLSAVSGLDVTVPFTVSGTATGGGTDHDLANGAITVLAGSAAGSVTFNVTQDSLDEPDETVVVTLGGPTNATLGSPAVQTVTLQDDDAAPTLSIADATQVEGNTGSQAATLTVTLTGSTAQTVTVGYATSNGTATAGSDYQSASGTLTFAPGETGKTLSVLVNGDTAREPAETVTVTLSSPVNASLGTSATLTITDDDGVPSRDLDGDGKSDILWRSGANPFLWLMDGTTVKQAGYLSPATTDWRAVGFGDFDGDGRSDILWRADFGATYVWFMNGLAAVRIAYTAAAADNNWRIAGVADFDGDRKADVLWRKVGEGSDTGQLFLWLMDGTGLKGAAYVTPPTGVDASMSDPNWRVQDLSDFDGDGKADILWRHAGGRTQLWLMDGAVGRSGSGDTTAQADLSWQFQDAGDFNGDAKADILWRSATGELFLWLLDGRVSIGAGSLGTVTSDWLVDRLGDFNGDGKADILWRSATGETYVWLMNGLQTVAGTGATNAQADNSWRTQEPR
jgi:hypothetical protein